MKLRVLPSAMQDLRRGQDFYSRQGESLGEYFIDSLFSDIDSLELYAGVHGKAFGYHRLLADDVCIVWRILDCRQNPMRVMSALKRTTRP